MRQILFYFYVQSEAGVGVFSNKAVLLYAKDEVIAQEKKFIQYSIFFKCYLFIFVVTIEDGTHGIF